MLDSTLSGPELRRQLAQQDPGRYLADMARTLTDLAFLEKNQNRLEESRAHYKEALNLYLELAQGDGKFAGNVAQVEVSLQDLENKAHSH